MAGTDRWRLFYLSMPNNKKLDLIKKMLSSNPAEAWRFVAADQGLNPDVVDTAQTLFGDATRIDLITMHTSKKGFILIINQRLSLWFYKRGTGYVYDGHEIGPYDQGKLDPDEDER